MVRRARGLGSLRTAAIAVVALVGATVPAWAQSPCGAILDDCLDDFTCYSTRTVPGTPRFVQIPSVSVVDDLDAATVSVTRQQHICPPTDKNLEGVIDPETHLISYAIRRQSPRHLQRTNIVVTNQLGEIHLSTIKPELLLVPSAKDFGSPPSPPDPMSHSLDHYKCYRVRVTPGTPSFAQGTTVQASDQFEVNRLISLVKPSQLCLAVDKNGEGVKNPQAHYLCYNYRPAIGSPRHTRRLGMHVNNQFGPLRLDTQKEKMFCIPSTMSFSP
jgi:hypothetical protein